MFPFSSALLEQTSFVCDFKLAQCQQLGHNRRVKTGEITWCISNKASNSNPRFHHLSGTQEAKLCNQTQSYIRGYWCVSGRFTVGYTVRVLQLLRIKLAVSFPMLINNCDVVRPLKQTVTHRKCHTFIATNPAVMNDITCWLFIMYRIVLEVTKPGYS